MVRIIQAEELRPLLRIDRLIDPMRRALEDESNGRATSPITVLYPTAQSDLHVKSATLAGAPVFTVKMAGWSQTLALRGDPPTTGIIAVFDSNTCELLALINDEHLISDYRTAASGAVVADCLARQDASVLAVVGTGLQARLQAEAVCLVRDIRRIIVWGRSPSKAESLAKNLENDLDVKCVAASAGLSSAISNSDIVVSATAAKEPLISGEWLRAGQHVTSVGSDDSTKAELSLQCLDRADLVVVDSLAAARKYGNLARAATEATRDVFDSVHEIGALLASDSPGRTSKNQITLASLVGLGVQDLAAVMTLRGQLW